MSIILGNKKITRNGRDIYVIAEIGQNHQGSLDIAKDMILQAKISGADCAKFQKSCLSAKFTKSALNRKYDSANSWGSTYGDHKRFLEFELDEYKELKRFSEEVKIDFTASAMDEVSLEQLNSLDVPFIKIGSGDTNNFPLLEKASRLQRPLVISTGMQQMTTIEKVVEIMRAAGKINFALLHCVSSYPTDPSDCNLKIIELLMQKYKDILIGYSGHELGIDISIAAVHLGARIIERHFTLDKTWKGSDHSCSLTPKDFKEFIQAVESWKSKDLGAKNKDVDLTEIVRKNTQVKVALKEIAEKTILPCELSCKEKLGKSIVTSKELKFGKILEKSDICIKVSEPNGIPAEEYYNLIGAILKSNLLEDVPIQYSNIEFRS